MAARAKPEGSSRWSWRIFKSAFIGAARNPREWLFREVRQTLRRQSISLIFFSYFLFFS
jgi:hypothetical protein